MEPIEPTLPPTFGEPAPAPKKKVRTIDSLWTFLIATSVLGPFALPLLWRNPRFKWTTKVAGSLAVLAFTYFLLEFASKYLKGQLEMMQDMVDQARLQKQQGL